MIQPKISIIATAIHTEFWQQLYADLNVNNIIPFEIVFVGHVKPDFPLPSNFIHIHINDSPVKCLETACRNSHGEYVMITADDVSVPPGMLNTMDFFLQRMISDKAVVLARFADTVNGPPRDNLLVLDTRNPKSPIVGVNTIIKTSVWRELGGLDKRFYAFKADLDMQMRVYEAGGYPFIVPNCYTREKPRPGSRLVDTYAKRDGDVLYAFWVNPDGSTSRKRLLDVQSFATNEIPIVR